MARVVVVSGGGTGIGRAAAERFAKDGDQVVLVGRREKVLLEAAAALDAAGGAPAVATVVADLADPASVERLRGELADRFGHVDVLVNNAGGNREIGGDFPDGPAGVAEVWTENFRANVLTAVLAIEGLRGLLADGARVLLLSSIAAYRGSGTGSYAAAKAALHPYACDLAAQLGPRGITVNTVAPGYIADTEFFGDIMTDERRQARIAETDTGRAGTPADVADTLHWLASPGARHVTGQVVQINGGARKGD